MGCGSLWFIVGFANVCHITLLIFINLPHKGEGEGVGWRMMKVDEGHEWFKSSLRFHREVQQLFHFPGCWRKNLSYWDALTAVDVGPFSACDLGHDAIRCPNGPLPRVSGCGLWASDFLDFSSSQDFASGWDGNGQQHLTASNGQLPTVDRCWQALWYFSAADSCRL